MLIRIRVGKQTVQEALEEKILSGELTVTPLSKKELFEVAYKAKFYLKHKRYPKKITKFKE